MSKQSRDRPSGGDQDQYVIRPYESRDAADLCALYETVWGRDLSEEWIEHRHQRNPYFEETSIIVAEADGEVVGARPFVPFPTRLGTDDFITIYLVNLMVHPDHRRRGLFTRMTTRVIETYANGAASLSLNFANELSAGGYRKIGFREIGIGPEKSVRVQRPGRLVRDRLGEPIGRVAGSLADRVASGYLSIGRLARGVPTRWRIERRSGIPAEQLTRLYDYEGEDADERPATLHTRREEALYRWLADDPTSTYETYLASADGSPEAAIVVRNHPGPDSGHPWIVDAVPTASTSSDSASAFTALLDTALADHRDAVVVFVGGLVVFERLFPDGVLSSFGFHSSTQPLVSRFTMNPDTAFVHPIGTAFGEDIAVGDVDLSETSNWQFRIR